MSSELAVLIRHRGEEFSGLLSSGMVTDLFYDPAFYSGDPRCFAKLQEWLEPYPRRPAAAGMIAMDIDVRRRWDMQGLRNLTLLSRSLDYTWLHFDALNDAGWLCEGLYRNDGSYARKFSGAIDDYEHAAALASREAAALVASGVGRAEAYSRCAVHLKLQPPDWEWASFDLAAPESKRALMNSLRGAGFEFSETEALGWL